jgi:hypothetical protein
MTYFFQDPELTDGSEHNFIGLPIDEWANTQYGQVVILARVEQHPEATPDTYGSAPTLHILEPADFREKWPTIRSYYFARTRPDIRPGDVDDVLYLELIKELITERGTKEDNWMLEALERGKGIK